MNNDINNQKRWENEIKQHVQLYPNERVVAFLARNYKDRAINNSKKALDIGFGGGRHLKLLLDYGFNTYGVDYVEECKNIVEDILGEDPNLKELVVGDFKDKSFGDTTFDVIIMWGVVFLRTKEDMLKDLKVLHQMLTGDGKLLLNFRTKDDTMYKKGKEVAKDTYLLDATNPAYEGMMYTFLDPAEIEELVDEAGFKMEYIEREEYWKKNLTERHTWWVVALSKK